MITKLLALFAIFIPVLNSAHQFDHQFDNHLYHEILSQIEANRHVCVARVSEGRIYLKADRLYPTERGMYLNLNDIDYVHLPILHCDTSGCYFPCVETFNRCPGCGVLYFIRCTNSDCPLHNNHELEQKRSKHERKKDKKKKKK